jgi:hypothetical protein
MKTAATLRGGAWIGPTHLLLWIGIAIFGLFGMYLVAQGPAYQAARDETVRHSDQALCVKFGFPAATPENLSCIDDLRGVRNNALEMNAGIL